MYLCLFILEFLSIAHFSGLRRVCVVSKKIVEIKKYIFKMNNRYFMKN